MSVRLVVACLFCSLAGCSSSGGPDSWSIVPPPAQGGLNISVGPPFAGGSCPSTGFNATIALRDGPDHRQNDPGDRMIDGDDDATVSCRVAGSNEFGVSGNLERLGSSFSLTGGTIAGGGTGTASASMLLPDLANALTSAEPCSLSVATRPLEVAAGRIWAIIECPNLSVENDPGGAACAARGEFVFENCAQK
jgi:hypothetical protein